MRPRFQLVRKRLQLGCLAEAMRKRLRDHPVRQPRVPRQQRAVQVGADCPPDPAALEAALPVVPEPGHHATERGRTEVEARPPRMVLEAGKRPPQARLELALEQDIADHPPLARHRLVWEQTHTGQLLAGHIAVGAAEQLVPAADREHGRARLDGGTYPVALGGEVGSHERLFAILTASDVEEVVLARLDGLAHADRPQVDSIAAPGRPALEHGDVATIGVDVQVVGIQVPDDEARHAARSQ